MLGTDCATHKCLLLSPVALLPHPYRFYFMLTFSLHSKIEGEGGKAVTEERERERERAWLREDKKKRKGVYSLFGNLCCCLVLQSCVLVCVVLRVYVYKSQTESPL